MRDVIALRAPTIARNTDLRRWLLWFVVGVVTALALQAIQVRAVGGGLDGLLSVGGSSALRLAIESDLGEVAIVDGGGHDGQFSYLIARDPLNLHDRASSFDHGAYRYRRVLLPALAGGFGWLGARATLVGLMVWTAIGMGLAAGSAAELGQILGARRWVVVGVLANPGLWLSVQLLTTDTLALGLGLSGVVLWMRRWRVAALAALALAALSKEPYVLFAWGLAGWSWFRGERRDSLLLGIVPLIPLVVWSAFLSLALGDGFAVRGNLTMPGLGLAGSVASWIDRTFKDLVWAVVALAGVLLAAAVPVWIRRPLLAWLSWPWVIVALLSSEWVWDLGNNAIRAFAPAITLGTIGLAIWAAQRSRPAPASP